MKFPKRPKKLLLNILTIYLIIPVVFLSFCLIYASINVNILENQTNTSIISIDNNENISESNKIIISELKNINYKIDGYSSYNFIINFFIGISIYAILATLSTIVILLKLIKIEIKKRKQNEISKNT